MSNHEDGSMPREVEKAHVMHELYNAQVKLAGEEDEDLGSGGQYIIRQSATEMAEGAGRSVSQDLHIIEPHARNEMEQDLAKRKVA